MDGRFCAVDECVCLAHRDGLCRAHYERRVRGTDLRRPIRVRLGTWATIDDAIHQYVDAPTDAAFKAAKTRAQRAMRAWVRARDRARRTCVPSGGD